MNEDFEKLVELLQTSIYLSQELIKKNNELKEIRSTLLVNFGKECRFDLNIEDSGQSTFSMLFEVLEKLCIPSL